MPSMSCTPSVSARRRLGSTASTTARRCPSVRYRSWRTSRAACTAPHESCPSTTTSGVPSTVTAYSTLPSTSGPAVWPAVRTTNRSPSPRSKMISAASRESEQPTITANGCCPSATAARCPASWLGWRGAPPTKRRLPATSSAYARAGSLSAVARSVVRCGPGCPPGFRNDSSPHLVSTHLTWSTGSSAGPGGGRWLGFHRHTHRKMRQGMRDLDFIR